MRVGWAWPGSTASAGHGRAASHQRQWQRVHACVRAYVCVCVGVAGAGLRYSRVQWLGQVRSGQVSSVVALGAGETRRRSAAPANFQRRPSPWRAPRRPRWLQLKGKTSAPARRPFLRSSWHLPRPKRAPLSATLTTAPFARRRLCSVVLSLSSFSRLLVVEPSAHPRRPPPCILLRSLKNPPLRLPALVSEAQSYTNIAQAARVQPVATPVPRARVGLPEVFLVLVTVSTRSRW